MATIKSGFLNLLIKDKTPSFPESLGDYTFRELLKKYGPKKSYQLAIYTDKKGNKAIAKMRSNKIKGYHYYSLKNEVEVYKVINAFLENHYESIPEEFKNIHIPKLLLIKENDTALIMLMEYMEGKPTMDLSNNKKVELLFKTGDFLNFVGDNIAPELKSRISTRSNINLFSFYPILLIRSLINFPELFFTLLKGAFIFYSSAPSIVKTRIQGLTHRDLHFYNIMTKDEDIILIDLQQCVFSNLLQEYITILRYYWADVEFSNLLLSEIIKRNANNPYFNNAFRGLIINSITHGLTDKSFSKEVISCWVDLLKLVTSNRFDKKMKEAYV